MDNSKLSGKFLLLGLIWLLFSIPVVTVGISTCAAIYVALKLLNGEEGNLFKLFVKGFKQNLLQGFFMSILSVMTLFAAGYFWYWIISSDNLNFIYGFLAVICSLLVITYNVCAYPIIARYENTFVNILKNTLAVSITFYKKTFKMAVFVVIEIVIPLILCKLNLFVGLATLLFWPCVIFFTISFYMNSIFYEVEHPKVYDDEEESEDNNPCDDADLDSFEEDDGDEFDDDESKDDEDEESDSDNEDEDSDDSKDSE